MSNLTNQVSIVVYGFWTVDDCRRCPGCLFVFGDNLINKGKAGQAVIRDEPNTIGIPTKKRPSWNKEDFFTDDEYYDNIEAIVIIKTRIIELMRSGVYRHLILPSAGWGTGLALLDKKAPQTFKFCRDVFDELVALNV